MEKAKEVVFERGMDPEEFDIEDLCEIDDLIDEFIYAMEQDGSLDIDGEDEPLMKVVGLAAMLDITYVEAAYQLGIDIDEIIFDLMGEED